MFVHGDNLTQKENHRLKYRDRESREFLVQIRRAYDLWMKANVRLKGPFSSPGPDDTEILKTRLALFANYKDFIDQQHFAEKFDSRSGLHSSVLEEFVYYLFRDLVLSISPSALIGKAHTFKDIFFMPESYEDMIKRPNARIEKKDHDFVIGVTIRSEMACEGQSFVEENVFQIPAVAIECKTYLDKTMLEGSSTAAEQLKTRNPNAIYIVVAEWLKLTEQVNLRKYKVDQIYVLRKQRNTDREYRFAETYQKNPLYLDVVEHLYESVRTYLTYPWEAGIRYGLERGYLLQEGRPHQPGLPAPDAAE